MGELPGGEPAVEEPSLVVGSGPLADALRAELADVEPVGSVVIVPPFVPAAGGFEALDDDAWGAGFDGPFEAGVRALAAAYRAGVRRIVVVLPTSALTGAGDDVAMAAAAEALRATVKSAARQWGPDGVVVNAVALDPSWFGAGSAGVASLSGRALGRAGSPSDVAPIVAFLTSEGARHLTGATLVADGGVLM